MPYTCPGCYQTCSDFAPHTCAHYIDPLTGETTPIPPEPPTDMEPTAVPMPSLPMHISTAGKATLAKHQCETCGVWMDAWVNSHSCHPPADGVSPSISGVQKCPSCGEVFARAHGHAVCTPAQQTTFFHVPPPPQPRGWSLQWCWKPETQRILAMTIPSDQLPQNDWVPHTAYQNVTTKAQAQNAAKRYRRVFPCKKWRVRATTFHDSEGGVYTVVI